MKEWLKTYFCEFNVCVMFYEKAHIRPCKCRLGSVVLLKGQNRRIAKALQKAGKKKVLQRFRCIYELSRAWFSHAASTSSNL